VSQQSYPVVRFEGQKDRTPHQFSARYKTELYKCSLL